jgi:hypothetical protein
VGSEKLEVEEGSDGGESRYSYYSYKRDLMETAMAISIKVDYYSLKTTA